MNVFRLACCRSYATGTDRVGRDGAFPTLKKQHYPPPQLKQQHPDLYDRYEVSFTTRSSEDGSNNSTGGDTSHSPSSSSPRSRTPSPPVPGDSVGVTDTTNVLGISRRFHGAVDYNDGDDEGAFGGGGGGRVGRPRQQQQQLSYGSRRRNRKKRSMCSTTTTMNAAMRLHHQRRNGINPPGPYPRYWFSRLFRKKRNPDVAIPGTPPAVAVSTAIHTNIARSRRGMNGWIHPCPPMRRKRRTRRRIVGISITNTRATTTTMRMAVLKLANPYPATNLPRVHLIRI